MRTVVIPQSCGTYVQSVDDRAIAAEVRIEDDLVRVQFHSHGGHIRPAVRADVVDAVLDLPEVRRRRMLHATVPLGDVELLGQLTLRCVSMTARAAGSTCLVEAELWPRDDD
jgi:hypothetical protein